MKTISKYIISLFLAIFIFGITPIANASTALFPKPIDDYLKENIINSYLVTTNNGYMRVYYDENSNKVGIEYYDSNFNITSTKSIAMELNKWGGFYKGKDAYYLIEGQDNENEEYDAEYMRVIKYDFNWNKKGTAKVTTALPDVNSAFIVGKPPSNSTSGIFYASTVSVEEYNNTLYIATGHSSYRDSVGDRHQGLLLVAVDESTMECHIVDENFYHSVDHYLATDGADIYMADSRTDKYLYLSVYDSNMYSGDTYSDRSERTKSKGSVLDYKYGDSYNTILGMELSGNNVLTLFESADLEAPDIEYAYHCISNIYLAVTPKSNMTKEATTIKKLADYSASYSARVPFEAASMHITKINNNRFLIIWGDNEGLPIPTDRSDAFSGYTLHYIFVDGNGNSLTQEYTVNARVSECPPVLNGSKVVFSSSSDDAINFYTIDANSGAFTKKVYNKSVNNDTPSSSSTTTSSSTSSVKPQSSSTVSSSSSSVKPQSSSSSKSSSKSSSSSIKPQSSSSTSSSVPASSSSSSVTESSTATSSSSAEDTPTSSASSSVGSASSSVSTSSSSSSTSSVPAESVSSSNGSSGNNSSSSSVNSIDNTDNTPDNGLWIIIAIAGGAVVVAGVIIAVVVAKKKR